MVLKVWVFAEILDVIELGEYRFNASIHEAVSVSIYRIRFCWKKLLAVPVETMASKAKGPYNCN